MKLTGSSIVLFMASVFMQSCQSAASSKEEEKIKLITLAPAHFHAALVQKEMYQQIDSVVHVYAPEGAELNAHLNLVKQYNERPENPTHWVEELYTGNDFLEKMLEEKKGNVVVLAGNNLRKTDYIKKSIDGGFNVLSDKPMAINTNNFQLLEQAFADAEKNKVLLYDIMTERSEITNILQKEFSHIPEVFGELKKGSVDDPSVFIESVHFFYKYVSGKVLTRPDWFFDPLQQGDAIADVGTHLVDLVQWQCFPEKSIDYKKDIEILSAKTWPTPLGLSQFASITKKDAYPDFLKQYVKNDSILQTHANGEMNYTINGIHTKIIARWDYKAPEGSGDTHYSILKGTKANIEIRQGQQEDFQPTLYIIPAKDNQEKNYAEAVQKAVEKINGDYPGIAIEKTKDGWKVIIPQKYKVGHEAHFAQVMERYLNYLKAGKLPDWEVPNMIAKYYTTTKALEMAQKQ